MITEEAITNAKELCGVKLLTPIDEQAIQKLISLAEQVERVKGVERKPVRYETCERTMKAGSNEIIITKRNITYSKEDEAFNQADSQWRALIVGKLENLEKVITDYCICASMEAPQSCELGKIIRNLFLGETK